jgi:hypothetical protein
MGDGEEREGVEVDDGRGKGRKTSITVIFS